MTEFKLEARNAGQAFFKLIETTIAEGSIVGNTREIGPVMLTLMKPRERLVSFKHGGSNPIYPYIEGLWMLMGEDKPDRIMHYSRFPQRFVNIETQSLDGAYGPRLIGTSPSAGDRGVQMPNQLDSCWRKLRNDPENRRAVCIINNPLYDWNERSLDIPCTLTFQFLNRNGELHMITNMRSQDVIKGYPNDITEFQWFQEIMAGWLGLEVGLYHHIVGSLHIYEKDLPIAKELIQYDKGFELYDIVKPLDARLTKEDYYWQIEQINQRETEFRTDPDKYVEDIMSLKWGESQFYASLARSIVAYNLNKAGYLEEAYMLVKDGKTDIEYTLKDKWRDIVEG